MKVLVDIGNSRIKWAVIDENGLSESQSFPRGKTSIKTTLNKAWKALENIESVHVANVAGEKPQQQLIEWSEKNWNITPVFITSEKKRFGVTNAYDAPEKLGIDRWLSLIVARQHARQTQCIIDCGTAMTIDIVTQNGQHQGGMILPGLSLMRSALVANTDALTEEPDEQEFKTLAANTYSAIQAGTLYCVTATLERVIADLRESFNNRIRFIITGGDAEHLLPLLSSDVHHYPDIVLKGLAFYARQKPNTESDQQDDDTLAPETDTSTEIAETSSADEHIDTSGSEENKEDVNSKQNEEDLTVATLEHSPESTEIIDAEQSKEPTAASKPRSAAKKMRKPRQTKTKIAENPETTLPE